jgi:hypothetical protein
MEVKAGYDQFFFRPSYKEFSTFAKYIRTRFKDLFTDGESDRGGSDERNAFETISRTAEGRFNIGVRISKEFNINIDRITLFEYFLLIETISMMDKNGASSN